MYQIGIKSRYNFTNNCKTILDDYSWWISLVMQICKVANNFEIRCWKGETDTIDMGKRFGNPIENLTTNELVFKGRITDEFQKEVTTNYLTDDNCLKWFTLIAYRDEIMLFMSEHYGTEAHLLNVSSDEISNVKSWIEQFSSIEIVHIDEMNEDDDVCENK